LLFRARSFGGIKGEDNELLARKMFGRRRRNGKWETENGKWDMGHGTWGKPSTETRKCIHVEPVATDRQSKGHNGR